MLAMVSGGHNRALKIFILTIRRAIPKLYRRKIMTLVEPIRGP